MTNAVLINPTLVRTIRQNQNDIEGLDIKMLFMRTAGQKMFRDMAVLDFLGAWHQILADVYGWGINTDFEDSA